MIVDIKCGNCKIIFPLNSADYLKRALGNEDNHRNRVICPSCWSEMPFDLKKYFDAFLSLNGECGWEVGTRHHEALTRN